MTGEPILSGPLADAAERIRLWREKPVAMVRELFGATPDPKQEQALEAFATSQRIAMKACKGPGKTCTEAWMSWNYLLTRPHPNIAATSITSDNLADGLWKEMSKWQQKSPLLTDTFQWQKTRIFNKARPETWFMSARTWPRSASREQQANTLAGLHADYMMFVLDESGGLPRGVMAAAEAGLTTGEGCRLVQAGNPTHLEGPLWDACTIERHLWKVFEITGDPDDPERSPRVDIEWARSQIAKYGRDDPWVLVNVFGRFPPSSINQLIGPEEVRAAQNRHYKEEQYSFAARVLGVDVARYGLDSSSICRRQGIVCLPFEKLRGVDSTVGGGRVATIWDEWDADGCLVDDTGGFGSGWIDRLRLLGKSPIGVQFAGKANSPKYLNKRAEIHFLAAQWVKDGGALPPGKEIEEDLCANTYTFAGDKLQVVDKDVVKALLGRSPDEGDSFACTFAQPIEAKPRGPFGWLQALGQKAAHALTEYDPFAGA